MSLSHSFVQLSLSVVTNKCHTCLLRAQRFHFHNLELKLNIRISTLLVPLVSTFLQLLKLLINHCTLTMEQMCTCNTKSVFHSDETVQNYNLQSLLAPFSSLFWLHGLKLYWYGSFTAVINLLNCKLPAQHNKWHIVLAAVDGEHSGAFRVR